MREVLRKIFRKIFWIISIILFFLVFLLQSIGELLGRSLKGAKTSSQKKAVFKSKTGAKRKKSAKKFQFKAKWVLIPLALLAFLFSANIAYRSVAGLFEEKEEKPKELYLIQEASQYIKEKEQFESGVKALAVRLEVPPEWLMAVMFMESRFNPAVENKKGSGAVGLIQFMVPTVREMNMRLGRKLYMQDIQNMSGVDQLELVENYLQTVRKRRGEFNSLTDLYLAILYPKAINRGMDYKLFSKPSKRYTQNSGLDMNKDGIVQVKDIDTRMKKMFPTAYEIKKSTSP